MEDRACIAFAHVAEPEGRSSTTNRDDVASRTRSQAFRRDERGSSGDRMAIPRFDLVRPMDLRESLIDVDVATVPGEGRANVDRPVAAERNAIVKAP